MPPAIPVTPVTMRDSALHLAAKVLRRGERLSASLRERIEAAPASPAGGGGRYGRLWNPGDVTEAIAEIYNTTDLESFERGGKLDSEWLSPYLSESATVLDFGCGIGRVARYVAPACKQLWAVDASPRMLELAAQRLAAFGNVRFLRSQDTAIPDVAAGSVDLVYSLLVLQHVEREDAFLILEELRRVLHPDGRAVLTFPNLLSDTYLESFLQYVRAGASTQANRARIYTPQEVERLLSAAGFEADIDAGTEIRVVAKPA